MEDRSIPARNVEGRAFVPITRINIDVKIVMVDNCARPHIVLPKKKRKYKGHCFFCFVHLFPTERAAQDYSMKETTVVTFLQEKFPNVDWRWNKTVEGGCSKRRLDLLLDMGSHIVIIEVDENSHDMYDPTCEEKRMEEIWNDVGHHPIVFVRFNPDKYKDKDGNNVPFCMGSQTRIIARNCRNIHG